MEIKGKIYCFFEQSGTFKNEFRKLGYEAEDYDIQNEFGQTDHITDLFKEIENGFEGKKCIFDNITKDDLVMAFFPCIYFCATSQMAFSFGCYNYRRKDDMEIAKEILERSKNREKYYALLVKLFAICSSKGLRLIVENPYSIQTYLKANFTPPRWWTRTGFCVGITTRSRQRIGSSHAVRPMGFRYRWTRSRSL